MSRCFSCQSSSSPQREATYQFRASCAQSVLGPPDIWASGTARRRWVPRSPLWWHRAPLPVAVQMSSRTAAAPSLFDCYLLTPASAGLFVTSLTDNSVLALIQTCWAALKSASVTNFSVSFHSYLPRLLSLSRPNQTLLNTSAWHMLPAPLLLFESLHQFWSVLQLSCLCAKPLHLGTQSMPVPTLSSGDSETRACLSRSDLCSSQPVALCWCTSVALTHKLYFNLHDTILI